MNFSFVHVGAAAYHSCIQQWSLLLIAVQTLRIFCTHALTEGTTSTNASLWFIACADDPRSGHRHASAYHFRISQDTTISSGWEKAGNLTADDSVHSSLYHNIPTNEMSKSKEVEGMKNTTNHKQSLCLFCFSAPEKILKYMLDQNRPYSAGNTTVCKVSLRQYIHTRWITSGE